jgi:hypothetical protein
METFFWLLGGGIACAVLGAIAGYQYEKRKGGREIDRMLDEGELLVEKETGWIGDPKAFEAVSKQWAKKK